VHQLLEFKNENLLRRALTHRSFINENPQEAGHNERLEFLGDAILNFLSGEYLYQLRPEMAEDEMTRRRSALVDEKQLAQFALTIGLNLRMRLGQGAIKEGGYQNPNLLSSTFEAVVGAYYLDHNQDITQLRPLIQELFDSVPQDIVTVRSGLDAKNRLQEFAQTHGATDPPHYVTERVGGTDHAPEYRSRVYIGNKFYGEGNGRNKKNAEKTAAENALVSLEKQNLLG